MTDKRHINAWNATNGMIPAAIFVALLVKFMIMMVVVIIKNDDTMMTMMMMICGTSVNRKLWL